MGLAFYVEDLLLVGQVIVLTLLVPLTKVEESFNTHALFDILELRNSTGLEAYDHVMFPGVVPRTFLGASLAGVLGKFSSSLVCSVGDSLLALVVCRLILGLLLFLSTVFFRTRVSKYLSDFAELPNPRLFSFLMTLLSFAQFHLPFYSSRLLPNTFGLLLTNLALGLLFSRTTSFPAFSLLGFAGLVFRSEICLLAGSVGLGVLMFDVPRFGTRIVDFIRHIFGGVFGLLLVLPTILPDSYFWGRFLLPEAEVLYFNTWLNRSSEWGEMPIYWYFAVALPKSLLLSCPLVLIGFWKLMRSKMWRMFGIGFGCLLFVGFYSILPHKEWRFICYVLPLFTSIGAFGALRLIVSKKSVAVKITGSVGAAGDTWKEGDNEIITTTSKDGMPIQIVSGSDVSHFCSVLVHLLILGSFLVSLVFLLASVKNYPGGRALQRLHELVDSNNKKQQQQQQQQPIRVHLGVDATMTGLTKFLWKKNQSEWEYSKQECSEPDWKSFDFLLTGHPEIHQELFATIAIQKGFGGFDLNEALNFRNPIRLVDRVWIMQRLNPIGVMNDDEEERESATRPSGRKLPPLPKPIVDDDNEEDEEDVVLTYTEKDLSVLRVPIMKWYQRWPKLIINMIVYDVGTLHYKFTNRSFTIISELHKAHLDFYTYINIEKSTVKIRKDKIVVIVAKRKRKENWPRLLQDKISPDYLRIDWDEWDDEFTVEVQDKAEEHIEDPEADGYKFRFGESFFMKYHEKVKPEERDTNQNVDLKKILHQPEDFSPYLEFIEEEKRKVDAVVAAEEKEEEELSKGKEKQEKKIKRSVSMEPKQEEEEQETTKVGENEEKEEIRPTLVSEELPKMLFSRIGWSTESREETMATLRETISPFGMAVLFVGYFAFVLFLLLVVCHPKKKAAVSVVRKNL